MAATGSRDAEGATEEHGCDNLDSDDPGSDDLDSGDVSICSDSPDDESM